MVAFNYSTMQMTAKVVYYGPGLGGKTTNLQYIYDHTSSGSRGEMVLLETEADRTLFFDLLPIEVGSIGGFRTRIQLYTVPGQVFYNTTRKLVLKGVDGVVFVADSQRPMAQANLDSFRNLEENLAELDLTTGTIPLVLQYNKRDLPDIRSVEELDESLNTGGWPSFEASAVTGLGVFETLKAVSKLTLRSLRERIAEPNREPRRRRHAVAAARLAGSESEKPATSVATAAPVAPPERSVETRGDRPPKRSRVQAALEEFEQIRQRTLHGIRPRAERQPNGHREISREIRMNLSRDELESARRFSFSLQLEDSTRQVSEVIPSLDLEVGDDHRPTPISLRLHIDLDSEE